MTRWSDKQQQEQLKKYQSKANPGKAKESKIEGDINKISPSKTPKTEEVKVSTRSSHPDLSSVYFWPFVGPSNEKKQSKYACKEKLNVTWDSIAGLEQAKADIQEAIELPTTQKSLYAYYNKKPLKGILLAGPPGCGKTMLGKAAATSLARLHNKEPESSGFLYIKGPEILNCYVGESEKNVRQIFADARQHFEEHKYPAIVFIDEADAILESRDARGWSMSKTIVPQFLTEMDGLTESSAIVMLATNRPEALDSAVIRDGRIDRKIYIDRPDEKATRHILTLALTPLPRQQAVQEIVDSMVSVIYSPEAKIPGTNKWLRDALTGAMITNLVNLAVSIAMNRDITQGTRTGVTVLDGISAINRMLQQSKVGVLA